jgi:hypothetical protein
MLCALATIAPPTLANGVGGSFTIDFDNIPPSGNPELTSFAVGDFRFTSGHFHSITEPAGGSYALVDNGTPYLFQDGGPVGQPITLSRADGLPFALLSIDLGEGFLDDLAAGVDGFSGATTVEIITTTNAPATPIAHVITLDSIRDGAGGLADFQSFTLPAEFCNVTSVTFHGHGPLEPASVALDNVVVGPVIPEPSTAALVLVGGLTLFARFRRSRKN